MIQTLDLRGQNPTVAELVALIPRASVDVQQATETAVSLIEDVRARGSAALLAQSVRFDGCTPSAVRVPADELESALLALDPDVRSALTESIARVRHGSRAQIPAGQETRWDNGAAVRQRWQPVRRVGLYVPGGKAVYPSSVVMNAVPAQEAGVASIALASPAQRAFGGGVHPVILAAAQLLGIDEVYAMGGAGAIGAFAYGVPDLGLEPVDVVTGPGNVFVAAAKRAVRSVVGIDAEAGPTEILIIADDSAVPNFVAADLISQAEHDELASAVLVTTSVDLADRVVAAVAEQVEGTKHRERVIAALSGDQSAIVLVDDLDVAARFSNSYGPEHLELQVVDNETLLSKIESAGAIFIGDYSPVSLGDYLAGSNHVLPTGGQARFSSGLGAYTFLRPQQVISYSESALRTVADKIAALSSAEDLPAHGDSIRIRGN